MSHGWSSSGSDLASPTEPPDDLPAPSTWGPATLVASIVFLWHAAIAVIVGMRGWDDGAITVAFARTFAMSGRIALTPESPQVEGFSSPLWFLLNSVVAAATSNHPYGLVLASQLLAAVGTAVAATCTFLLLRRRMPFLGAGMLVLAIFLLAPAINETANGMEMSTLAAVALGIVLVLDRDGPTWALVALAAAIPALRLEATGYVVAGASVMLLLGVARARATAILISGITTCAILTAARLALFGIPVPATILAKQHAPYSSADPNAHIDSIATVIGELALILVPAGALALAVLVACGRTTKAALRSRVGTITTSASMLFAGTWVLAVCGVNMLIGSNWGYLGRMEQSALPLAVLVVAAIVPPVALRGLKVATFACFPILIAGALSIHISGIGGVGPITVAYYQQTGRVLDNLRARLNQDTLSVAIPDVGGTGLSAPRLRVHDLGMLTSPELAAHGLDDFGNYLARTSPEVIEVHGRWALASRIYELPGFQQGYRPVALEGMWVYLRQDVYERIAQQCVPLDSLASASLRYRGYPSDEQYVATLGMRSVCRL